MLKKLKKYSLVFVITLLMFLSLTGLARAVDQPVTITLAGPEDSGKLVYRNITNSQNVLLNITNNTDKELKEMGFSETGRMEDVEWIVYSSLALWKFSDGDGQKAVYAWFKTKDGEIIGSAADFIYDISPPELTFNLVTNSVGPNTMDIFAKNDGQDKWLMFEFDYRISLDPNFKNSLWYQRNSDIIKLPFENLEKYQNGEIISVYFQTKDRVGNLSAVETREIVVDLTPPVIYVSIEPSNSLKSTVTIESYDEFSRPTNMMITNDPLFNDGITSGEYTKTVEWQFDERRVVWVKVSDEVGNWTEPYPSYLRPLSQPTSKPGEPTPTVVILPTIVQDEPDNMSNIEFQEFKERVENLENMTIKQERKITFLQSLLNKILNLLYSIFPSFKKN